MNKLKTLLVSLIIGLAAGLIALAFTGSGSLTPGTGNPDFWLKSGYDVYYNPAGGGNVGIGMTGPSFKLDVAGDTRLGAGYKLFLTTVDGTGNWSLGDDGSENLRFVADSGVGGGFTFRTYSGGYGDRLTITNAGNVGIGTTGPTNKLSVAGALDVNGSVLKLAGALEGNSYVRCGAGSSINGSTIVCNDPQIAPSNVRKFGSYNLLPLGSFAEARLLICRALGAERDISYTTAMDGDHNLYYTLSTNLWNDSYGNQLSVNQLVCGPSCHYWLNCPD